MISHKLKFVFIHIPKTSGNSLSLLLKKYSSNKVRQRKSNLGCNQGIDIICEKNKRDIKHVKLPYYQKLYGNKIQNYFKFTIVRNPYDRILSFYFWAKGKHNQIFNRREFIQFVKRNNNFQYKFITHDMQLIKYENLITGLKKIKIFKNKVNFDAYPSLNCSINSKMNYRKFYDKKLKDLVYNKFLKDFDVLGYRY